MAFETCEKREFKLIEPVSAENYYNPMFSLCRKYLRTRYNIERDISIEVIQFSAQ